MGVVNIGGGVGERAVTVVVVEVMGTTYCLPLSIVFHLNFEE